MDYAIIPAFNEGKNIKEVVSRVKRIGLIPIVVDDGSTDNTYLEAKNAGAEVRSHFINKGKGESLKTGFNFIRNSDFDNLVIVDSDMQYDPAEAKKLIVGLKNADYVVGCRDWSKVPLRHRLGNQLLVFVFNFLFETKLKDVCCGFVAMKKEVMKRLDVCGGYVVDSYMLIQSLRLGYKIKNIPVSVKYNHKRDMVSGIRIVIGIIIFMLMKKKKEVSK